MWRLDLMDRVCHDSADDRFTSSGWSRKNHMPDVLVEHRSDDSVHLFELLIAWLEPKAIIGFVDLG
jgi:hypothetical protein